jgi:crotonobetainyl-CoA:carnitine CoA-transferase CaiB-like acyl-CoA transferase
MPDVLRGIRVLDLTQNIAGPYCTQLLGDFGATVWKVERPGVGDDARHWAPVWGTSGTAFLAHNRNKSSICIDLADPKGRAVVHRIAKHADVLVHSMRPETIERLGFGYDAISRDNPGVIYCAISAFGEVGPLRDLPGYDALIQGYSGIMSVTGNQGESPVRVGVSVIDNAAGLWAFSGVLAALIRRATTGKGTKVTTSLFEVGISWVSMLMTNFLATGRVPAKMGSAAPLAAPYEAYHTADDWIMIAANNNPQFIKLCNAIKAQDLTTNSKFSTNELRVQNRKELRTAIEIITETASTGHWISVLRQAGIPCSPIQTIDQLCSDPQVQALQMIVPMKSADSPDYQTIDIPISLAGERAIKNAPPPRLGGQTDEVLCAAGFGDAEIASLRADKTIA